MPTSILGPPRPVAGPPGGATGRLALHPRLARPSVFLFVVLTAQLMVVLDTTIVNVALPSIQHGLGFSPGALSWVLNAYILTFGGLLLLGARAGDLLGLRRTFLAGTALFALSSLAGGVAVTGPMLLAARALQGIGGALAAPTALSLLTSVFKEGPERVRAIALYTTVSAGGAATGLVAGGLLTQLVSWRWVMFVNVPIGAVVWAVGALVLPEPERRRGRFDLSGALMSTAGMTGIVLGLVEAGTGGWTRPLTLGPLLGGAALLGLFARNEARAEEPILPLRLLTHRTRTSANAARGLLYAGVYGSFFFLSQFLQDVQHYDPFRAGVAFLPWPASLFVASQITGRVLRHRLAERTVILSGIAIATAGLLAATRLQAGTGYLQLLLTLVLIGAGTGTAFVTLTSASLAEVEVGDAGAASGLVNVSQQIGGAVGLAVLVTAFGMTSGHTELGSAAAAGGAGATRLTGAVLTGLHDVFGLAVGFGIVALVLAARGIGRRDVAIYAEPAPAAALAPVRPEAPAHAAGAPVAVAVEPDGAEVPDAELVAIRSESGRCGCVSAEAG